MVDFILKKLLWVETIEGSVNPRIHQHLHIDPKILHGNPIIRGTRIPVYIILDSLADGETIEEILTEYDISLEQLEACLDFASNLVRTLHIAVDPKMGERNE